MHYWGRIRHTTRFCKNWLRSRTDTQLRVRLIAHPQAARDRVYLTTQADGQWPPTFSPGHSDHPSRACSDISRSQVFDLPTSRSFLQSLRLCSRLQARTRTAGRSRLYTVHFPPTRRRRNPCPCLPTAISMTSRFFSVLLLQSALALLVQGTIYVRCQARMVIRTRADGNAFAWALHDRLRGPSPARHAVAASRARWNGSTTASSRFSPTSVLAMSRYITVIR